MRLFFSGLRKLGRRAATLVTFGLLAVLLTLIILAVSTTRGGPGGPGGGPGGNPNFDPLSLVTFPGAYELILTFVLQIGGLFALIYGAAIAGSEWTWGTLKAAVARGENRILYLLSLYAAIAVVTTVGLIVVFIIGVVAGAIGATIAGISLSGIGDVDAIVALAEPFARGMVGICAQAALGFAIATLARSQLAGIGAGIGIYFAGTFAAIFLPDIVRYLPFQLTSAATGLSGGFRGGQQPSPSDVAPDVAIVLLVVWLVGSLVVAAGFAERAEITG